VKPRRTVVYVAGFNFYYGALKGTPWKWLDPLALFQRTLAPENEIVKIRYFTARVQDTPSDPEVSTRQDTYIRAVTEHCPLVEFHLDSLWLDEAERRAAELESGKVTAIPGDEVFSRIEAKYKKKK